MNVWC